MKKGFYENLLLFSKTAQTNPKNSQSLNQRQQDLPRKATTESLQHPFPFSLEHFSPSRAGLRQGGGTQPVQGQAGSDKFKVISDEMSSAALTAAGKTEGLPILGGFQKRQQLQGLPKLLANGSNLNQHF